LTTHYINAGYINSGAVLPEQSVSDGVIHFRIVEGKTSEIHLEGQKTPRDYWRNAPTTQPTTAPLRRGFEKYVRDRIAAGARRPLGAAQGQRPLRFPARRLRVRQGRGLQPQLHRPTQPLRHNAGL